MNTSNIEDAQPRGKGFRSSRSFQLKNNSTKLRIFNEDGVLQSEEESHIHNPKQEGVGKQEVIRCSKKRQSQFVQAENNQQSEKQDNSPTQHLFLSLFTSLKIKQIIRNLLNSLPQRRLQFLKVKQYDLIDDKAIIIQEIENQRIDSIKQKIDNSSIIQTHHFLNRLSKILPVFYPQNAWKLAWDIIQVIAILTYSFYIPIHISLDLDILKLADPIYLKMMFSLLSLDILVNFNTGYFHKGQFITSRKSIAANYIKKQLILDLISILPLTVRLLLGSNNKIISFALLLFLIKTGNFSKIFSKLEERIRMKLAAINALQLLKLLSTVLFFTHMFCCVWIFIGQNSSEHVTWITIQQLTKAEWYEIYIQSYYFVTVTMVTVGYGDIVPKNQSEMMVSILMMLISCGVYAYTLNRVGIIFEELYQQQRQAQRDLMIINNYMDSKKISFQLKYQIREYLNYYWRESNQNNDQMERKILQQLSDTLRQSLLIEANKIVLKDSPIFNTNFSDRILQRTLPLIQEMHCTPEQQIFSFNQLDNHHIYFVEKGKVELFVPLSQKKGRIVKRKLLKVISDGESFGVRSFFQGCERYMSARSVDFTKLLFIRRTDFFELLKEFPEDYEQFCMIKDMLFQGCAEKIRKKCYSCGNSSLHDFDNCHYIQYVPNKYKIIRRVECMHQQREIYSRFQQNKTKIMKNLRHIQQRAKLFLEKNIKFINEQSYITSSSEYSSSDEQSSSSSSQKSPYFKQEQNENEIIEEKDFQFGASESSEQEQKEIQSDKKKKSLKEENGEALHIQNNENFELLEKEEESSKSETSISEELDEKLKAQKSKQKKMQGFLNLQIQKPACTGINSDLNSESGSPTSKTEDSSISQMKRIFIFSKFQGKRRGKNNSQESSLKMDIQNDKVDEEVENGMNSDQPFNESQLSKISSDSDKTISDKSHHPPLNHFLSAPQKLKGAAPKQVKQKSFQHFNSDNQIRGSIKQKIDPYEKKNEYLKKETFSSGKSSPSIKSIKVQEQKKDTCFLSPNPKFIRRQSIIVDPQTFAKNQQALRQSSRLDALKRLQLNPLQFEFGNLCSNKKELNVPHHSAQRNQNHSQISKNVMRKASMVSAKSNCSSQKSQITVLTDFLEIRQELEDFDKCKIFTNYFTRFNYDEIIRAFNLKQIYKLRKTSYKQKNNFKRIATTMFQRSSIQTHISPLPTPYKTFIFNPTSMNKVRCSLSIQHINPILHSFEGAEEYAKIRNFEPSCDQTGIPLSANNCNQTVTHAQTNHNFLFPSHQEILSPRNNLIRNHSHNNNNKDSSFEMRRKSHQGGNQNKLLSFSIRNYSSSQEFNQINILEKSNQISSPLNNSSHNILIPNNQHHHNHEHNYSNHLHPIHRKNLRTGTQEESPQTNHQQKGLNRLHRKQKNTLEVSPQNLLIKTPSNENFKIQYSHLTSSEMCN